MIAILCLNLNAQNSGTDALTTAIRLHTDDINRINLPPSEGALGVAISTSSLRGSEAGAVNLPAYSMREY
jgi:hypothetical protein